MADQEKKVPKIAFIASLPLGNMTYHEFIFNPLFQYYDKNWHICM